MIIPLLQTEGQICEANEHGGGYECAPHNMIYVFVLNLSHFFDHHEGTVIGIATFILALITAFLWDATRDLVVGAETAAERQQRAYVGVESIMLDCPSVNIPDYKPVPVSAGTVITDFVVLNIQNFGATPANKVYTWVNWFTAPYPESLPLNFDYPDWTTPLAPDVEISMIETSLFLSQKFASKIAMTDVNPVIRSNARKAFVYFYGRVIPPILEGIWK